MGWCKCTGKKNVVTDVIAYVRTDGCESYVCQLASRDQKRTTVHYFNSRLFIGLYIILFDNGSWSGVPTRGRDRSKNSGYRVNICYRTWTSIMVHFYISSKIRVPTVRNSSVVWSLYLWFPASSKHDTSKMRGLTIRNKLLPRKGFVFTSNIRS